MQVLKGVLVLINVTLIFLRYLKNHFKLGQDVTKNFPLILCIYDKMIPIDEHKTNYLDIWILLGFRHIIEHFESICVYSRTLLSYRLQQAYW